MVQHHVEPMKARLAVVCMLEILLSRTVKESYIWTLPKELQRFYELIQVGFTDPLYLRNGHMQEETTHSPAHCFLCC
jgi:hypothetical protein